MTGRAVIALLTVALLGVETLTAQREDRFAAFIGLARVKRDAGDRASSKRYFEEARRVRDLSPAEMTEYFWVLAETTPRDAVETGKAILRVSPGAEDVRDRTIAAALAARDEQSVVALAQEGARLNSKTARWPRRLAESALRRGQSAKAVSAYRTALRAPDASIDDRAGLAQALESAGQHALAVAAWNAVPAAARRARPAWEESRLRAMAYRAEAAVGGVTPEPGVAAGSNATRDDPWRSIEQLVSAGAFEPASSAVAASLSARHTCDERLLRLTDRIPDPDGTNLLIDALNADGCRSLPTWVERGIERTVAAGRHADALGLLRRLPAAEAGALAMRRLEGQLQLWTGDAAGAIRRLAPVLAENPADRPAREALMDAERAVGTPSAAWRTALPLLDDADLSSSRLGLLAELAIEADHPDRVAAILGRLPESERRAPVNQSLLGRALLARGRPVEAEAILSAIEPDLLSPAAALALIDSAAATRGRQAALERAEPFAGDTAEWRDVVSRRLTLAALSGRVAAAEADRRTLERLDPAAAALADAEIALALERPHDALAALDRGDRLADNHRALDLRATALAGIGSLEAAIDLIRTLRTARPEFVPFVLRETELRWRLHPTSTNLDAVLALPARFPGLPGAQIVAARTLASLGRHEDVLGAMGQPDSWPKLSAEGRELVARSLRASGRYQEALTLLDTAPVGSGGAALLRARLLAVVRGPAEAARAFEALAGSPAATADVYLAWAETVSNPAARLTVVTEAARRWPTNADVATRLSAARWAAGDAAGSLEAAEHAVTLDTHSGDAWFRLIDAHAASGTSAAIDDALTRFRSAATGQYGLVIGMADRIARLVRTTETRVLVHALAWLDDPAIPAALMLPRDIARVRLFAAAQRWPEALAAAEATVATHMQAPSTLRLRADVLSWSGRHDEAIAAYDDYLTVVPGDIDASRQKIRVAGWAGRFREARAWYAALVARLPDEKRVGAEARAKSAYFDARWRDAAALYEQWLLLEPDNGEARFEFAEALRAAGDLARADATLAALAADTGHRLAIAARDRAADQRRLSAAVVMEQQSANGYQGQRLLDVSQQGFAVNTVVGERVETALSAEGSLVRATSTDQHRTGYRAGVRAVRPIGTTVRAEGHVALWDVGHAARPTLQMLAQATWAWSDRVSLAGGLERQPLLENMATIDRGLSGTGLFAGASFSSPEASADIRSSWQHLSDGNTRTRLSFSGTRTLSERFNHVRGVLWGDVQAHRQNAATYFAPSGFLRVDAGVEYTHRLSIPRFRGDRQDEVAAAYLVGTDSRGTIYQHPSIRVAWEVSTGLALDARAGMIRSRTYNDTTLFVSLRLKAPSSRR